MCLCSGGDYRHGQHLTDLVTHTHTHTHTHTVNTSLIVLSSFCLPETTFHSGCVLSVLMCTPAETQQSYLDTFFFPPEVDRYTAHLDRRQQFYLKPCSVGPNVRYSVCHWGRCFGFFWSGGGVFLCGVFSLSPLTFISPRCSSCCTQLYYQSNGHVVHCKILYIESILLNVF